MPSFADLAQLTHVKGTLSFTGLAAQMTAAHWANLSNIAIVDGDVQLASGSQLTQAMYDSWPFKQVGGIIIIEPADTSVLDTMGRRLTNVTGAITITSPQWSKWNTTLPSYTPSIEIITPVNGIFTVNLYGVQTMDSLIIPLGGTLNNITMPSMSYIGNLYITVNRIVFIISRLLVLTSILGSYRARIPMPWRM
jgi:hypothetical protein